MLDRYAMKVTYPSSMSLERAVDRMTGLVDFEVGDYEVAHGPTIMDGVAEATIYVELEDEAMRNRPELWLQDSILTDGDFEVLVVMK